MLGEPSTTPLFSTTDFISLEPYPVRALDSSAPSWRLTAAIGVMQQRLYAPGKLLISTPGGARSFIRSLCRSSDFRGRRHRGGRTGRTPRVDRPGHRGRG